MQLETGTRLGPYEILAPLGAGGMGEVYRARDARLDREVAIKVMPEGARHDATARARFKREALALSRLNHPNIEMVLDYGEQDGLDYIVLEFVPGETLATRIARGRVPEREASALGAQVAEALAEAHERGVLHRDLKPGNIMVTPKGRVKVLDFGLARITKTPSEVTQSMDLTAVGSTPGTLAYMAPEQLLGGVVDARTDLYALGVVLYEMTTGAKPFQAALSTALANEVLHARVASPRAYEPAMSARAEAVILRAMDRDSGRRYQTADEVLGELRRLAAGEASSANTSNIATVAERRVTSIAVLPLENLSGDPSQEYFSDGMTEELIASLAQVRALRIISRTSVMRFKGQRRAIPDIARELNVDAVVEGSVRRAGERVRITVQLIDGMSEHHLWGRTYERDVKEVLALQGEVAGAIVDEIQVSVTPQEETRLKGARAVKPEAYEAYLKGRYFLGMRTEENLRLGLASLMEAVALDPSMELAHVGIADTYNLMGFMSALPPREAFPCAQASARHALEINPNSAEAMTSLGYATLWHDWDLAASEQLFRKSIDINPRYSQAHLWYANALTVAERSADAEAEMQVARTLDPLSSVAMAFVGWFPYWQSRFDDAVRKFDSARKLVPNFGPVHYWMGLALARAGKDAEAMASLARCAEIMGRTPQVVSAIGTAHALAGRRSDALAALEELDTLARERYVGVYYAAQVRVALGEHDAAFDLLEQALEERTHWLAAIRFDPSLRALSGDARFDRLVDRVWPGSTARS